MGSKKIKLRDSLRGSSPTIFQDVPDLKYIEKNIRFSLKDCDTRDWCIRKLENEDIKALYKRLGYFEQMTWKQISQIPREKGFSIEKKGDSNSARLESVYPQFSTFLHFRVTGTNSLFRVFAARQEDLCYILQFDPKGIINH